MDAQADAWQSQASAVFKGRSVKVCADVCWSWLVCLNVRLGLDIFRVFWNDTWCCWERFILPRDFVRFVCCGREWFIVGATHPYPAVEFVILQR